MGGPGAEVISAKGMDKAVDGRFGGGGRVGAVQEDVEFVTHDFVGEARGAIALVIWTACVSIIKVKVR